jgi:hypothetical protein
LRNCATGAMPENDEEGGGNAEDHYTVLARARTM